MTKRYWGHNRKWGFILGVFLLHAVISCVPAATGIKPGDRPLAITEREDRRGEGVLRESYNHIIADYVREVPPAEMVVHALEGMKKGLGDEKISYSRAGGTITVRSSDRLHSLKEVGEKTQGERELAELYRFVVRSNPQNDSLKIAYAGIRDMLERLDPHSSLLTPEVFREMQSETRGRFGGLGIEIAIRDKVLTVVAPIEGTPAFRAGIVSGDQILRIDGRESKDLNLSDAVRLMRGPEGTKVILTIMRAGFPAPRDFTLTRAIIAVQSVRHKTLEGGYGYLKINQFNQNTHTDMKAALAQMEGREGNLKGLILDLRDNPGGLLDQAVKGADEFLDGGLIVSTETRVESQKMKFYATAKTGTHAYPVVVLVNAGSASGTEILAAALQELGRGIILGTPTFGKGSVQTIIPLGDGSAIRLTTALYRTPKGNQIQQRGIIPDIIVETNREKTKREKDLAGALPGTSKESFPERPKIAFPENEQDGIFQIAHEILKKTPSPRLADLMATAMNMARVQAASLPVTEPPRKESASQFSSPAVSRAKDFPKIAVWDLVAGNLTPSYAQDLTSILVSEVSKSEKFEAYSQDNVRTLAGWTAERMALGCTDTKCLTALGQMDIAKLISGRVGKIGNRYSVSLNLFDTQNARAERSVSEFGRSEDELIDLVQVAVRKLLGIDAVPPRGKER
jgi:carboxyl-terminal processing protease